MCVLVFVRGGLCASANMPHALHLSTSIKTELQNSLEKEQKINVLRNKAIVEISISNLVVGDVCIIKYGKRTLLPYFIYQTDFKAM